ncbi:hypothetical protein [Hydrogenophaga sp. BPS33]|uniref:hypothetical protein n=1 Tax=Hydrogenophaga sp. BPS33 TaxID=2651974 RepID=UPI00131F6786|nr:hypothetical protein [Hydrogenophaga sp. BPS33]QHE87572.1 hypothetical protein F9K07_23085 [Hydrogenophaga sp. BPS33]
MHPGAPSLTRRHHQRLREIYRSAGWPCHDMLEVELLAAGLLERRFSADGFETLRVTDAGVRRLAEVFASNKAARTPHEALVERVAIALAQAGRIAWRGLALRVPLPRDLLGGEPEVGAPVVQLDAFESEAAALAPGHGWCTACPDVFSVRHTSVEAYLQPVVHEIKVSRADLLGDLKRPAKRAAYLAMAGACWYVLGQDAKGRPIAAPHEVPPACGVMQLEGERLVVAREAPRRAVAQLPFHVWMALARSGPAVRPDDDAQSLL